MRWVGLVVGLLVMRQAGSSKPTNILRGAAHKKSRTIQIAFTQANHFL